MSIKAILFDLDGTLLPMDQDVFISTYFNGLMAKIVPYGYEPKLLAKTIWQGTGAMMQNDGSKTNEQTFWDTVSSVFGQKILDDKPCFDEYYERNFDSVREVCGYTPEAKKTVMALKAAGYRVALTTNPVFPRVMTAKRLSWTGLDLSDFELYTTYENSRYSKPNLDYYRDIAEKLGVRTDECLMVGNDVGDDMVASALGMKVFLLTDCLINKENVDISQYPNGNFEKLTEYIKTL